MIIWINGTFGVGKTTTAQRLCAASSRWRLFDPEHVGFMLAANLRDVPVDDFQDLQPWRSLVPTVMAEVERFTGTELVAVQTVLVEDYWNELAAGITALGSTIFHVVLDCERAVIEARIDGDEIEPQARQWRHDHLDRFAAAKSWLTDSADLVIDTTHLDADQVVESMLAAVPV